MSEPRRIEPLTPAHDRASFSCGEPVLDAYLARQASQDVRRRVAQVFVMVGETPAAIAGYYSLAAASFARTDLAEAEARKLPHYPVPAAILGRLAVDLRYQGQGCGEILLLDAVRRVIQASAAVAVHAVIVDALSERAAAFYARYGFRPFPPNRQRLFLPLETFLKGGL